MKIFDFHKRIGASIFKAVLFTILLSQKNCCDFLFFRRFTDYADFFMHFKKPLVLETYVFYCFQSFFLKILMCQKLL